MAEVEERISEVTDAIKTEAMQRGFNLVSPVDPARHGALITLRSHKVDLLAQKLKDDDVIVSHRDDNLRISAHAYNNLEDVEQLMASLSRHKDLLV